MTMGLWTVVPMRGLSSGKQRLAGVLSPDERESLNRELLDRVLNAIGTALGGWQRCIVQSADPRVVEEVARRGAIGQFDLPGAGMNEALDQARGEARRRGAAQLLVLSADLPAITAQAVQQLVASTAGHAVAIVADKTGTGTNGLLLPTATDFRFEFGQGSLDRHWQQCVRQGHAAMIWRARALQFDLDTEDDLKTWRRHVDGGAPRVQGLRLRPSSAIRISCPL